MKEKRNINGQNIYFIYRNYDNTLITLEAKYIGEMERSDTTIVQLPNGELMQVDRGSIYEKLEDCLHICNKKNVEYASYLNRELSENLKRLEVLESKILRIEDWAKKRVYKPYKLN